LLERVYDNDQSNDCVNHMIISIIVGVGILASVFLPVYSEEKSTHIPSWIKNNAEWWAEGRIDALTFLQGIRFLIKQDTIKLPQIQQDSNSEIIIPSWLKQNASWWANGEINDPTFISAIQFLIDKGIVQVEPENTRCNNEPFCLEGTVKRIIDGDTIVVDGQKIRLSLVNTPEKYENGFKEATDFTKSLCPVGSMVIVDQDDGQPYDRFERMVGVVYCGNNILNAELLNYGHAKILTEYCDHSEFSLEDWAIKYGC